ncbi:hypothetical protein BC828DRAFT_347425, partial [Blastocladiella britannica]
MHPPELQAIPFPARVPARYPLVQARFVFLLNICFANACVSIQQLAELRKKAPEAAQPPLECGCCYDEQPPRVMIRCTAGHPFCASCVRRLLETAVGDRKTSLACMDASGCDSAFLPTSLERATGWKLLRAWEKIVAEYVIKTAGLEDFYECPFCDYGMILLPGTLTFRCEVCTAESCTRCRQQSHGVMACQEAEALRDKENLLNVQHKVEERMTAALLRQCPECKAKFVKDTGCNRMTCPGCKKLICYVCRVIIKDYEHFN